MQFSHQITRALHEEHEATINMIGKLETALLNKHRKSPPDVSERSVSDVLDELTAAVEVEMDQHFAFEEQELFPRLAASGDGDIGELLAEEHAVILPVGARLVALARAARPGGFDEGSWAEFHRLGGELVERLVAHVQKEEMALLPMLDDILDGDEDLDLANRYAMRH